MIEEILEQLNQLIELRVQKIQKEIEEEKEQSSQKEMKEKVERIDQILHLLPDQEREWLDGQLLMQLTIPAKERERYYKAGLSDAIDLLRFLKC